jgi:hypothetical protein
VNGFVNFFTFDPTPVMEVHGHTGRDPPDRQHRRGREGLRHRPCCFLYLPLRVILTEGPDGNAVLGVDVPADLFAAFAMPSTTPPPRSCCAAQTDRRMLVRVTVEGLSHIRPASCGTPWPPSPSTAA